MSGPSVVPVVEGLALYAYGHSHLASEVACTPGTRYIHRIRDRHHMKLSNRSASGFFMSDTCFTAMAGSGRWTIGAKGIVVVDAVVADVVYSGAGPVAMRRFENALRSLLALLTAKVFHGDASENFVYSGQWSSFTDVNVLRGGRCRVATAPDDCVDITFNGDAVTLLTAGFGQAVAHNAPFTICEADATLFSYTPQDEAIATGLVAQDFVNKVVPLTGFGAGSHTIRVKHGGVAGERLVVNGIMIPSETPPTVLVVMPLYLQDVGYAYGDINSDDSTVDTYAALTAAIVADSPHAIAVDPRAGWDPDTMTNELDGVHPNDRGQAHIAAAIDAALAKLDFRHGQNRLFWTDPGVRDDDLVPDNEREEGSAPVSDAVEAAPSPSAALEGLRLLQPADQNRKIASFRTRAKGRVGRELRDGQAFASDLLRSSRLRSERWFVIGDSNNYVLRPVRNALLRLRSTTLHKIGQPGEAERLLATALRWQPHEGTVLGKVATTAGERIGFPLPTEHDVAVLSYGEIDVRTHVQPQVYERKRSLDEVLDGIADDAIRLMEYFEKHFPGRSVFLSIKGPVGDFENPDYPCPASIGQRAEWTADLNKRIASLVAARSFESVGLADYWSDVVRPDGAMPPEYSDDYVHLSTRHFRIVRDHVREALAAMSPSSSSPVEDSICAAPSDSS